MNRKFCEFPAVGAQEAASAIRRMCSFGTGSFRNFRMLCRPFIVSKTSIRSLLLLGRVIPIPTAPGSVLRAGVGWPLVLLRRRPPNAVFARLGLRGKPLDGRLLPGDLLREGLDRPGQPRCFPVRRGVRIPKRLVLAHPRV